MAVQKGDFVEIEYTGKVDDEDKTVFDTTDEKIAKTQGIHSPKTIYGPAIIVVGEGQVIPGLDKDLVGKEPGKYNIKIEDIDAFGKKSTKNMKLVPAKVFAKDNIRPFKGLQVDIDGTIGTIITVSGGRIMVDFNHPLASRDIIYDYEVKRIITDTKEKVESFFKIMSFPVEKVEVKENNATVETKAKLPEELTLPLTKDIQRLTGVASIKFEVEEKTKKEVKPVETKVEEKAE